MYEELSEYTQDELKKILIVISYNWYFDNIIEKINEESLRFFNFFS